MLWPTMQLQEIAALLRPTEVRDMAAGEETIEVTDLVYDSRRTVPGSLFFCVPGERDDGHAHAAEAVRSGASAVVCQRPLAASFSLGMNVDIVVSPRDSSRVFRNLPQEPM